MTIWKSEVLLGGSESESTVGTTLDELADTLSGLNLELLPHMSDETGAYSEDKTWRLARTLASSSSDALDKEEHSMFSAFFYCAMRELTTHYETFRLNIGGRGNDPAIFLDLISAATVTTEENFDELSEPERTLIGEGIYELQPYEIPSFCYLADIGLSISTLYEVLTGDKFHLTSAFEKDKWGITNITVDEWHAHKKEIEDIHQSVEDFQASEDYYMVMSEMEDELDTWRAEGEAEQKKILPLTMPASGHFVQRFTKFAELLLGEGRGSREARDFEQHVRDMVLSYLSNSGLAPAAHLNVAKKANEHLAALSASIRSYRHGSSL